MVPLSERRHRLYSHEIPEVIKGLRLRLETLVEAKEEPEDAETAFRILYRLSHKGAGRPKYPTFEWEYLRYFLDFFDEIYKQDTLG